MANLDPAAAAQNWVTALGQAGAKATAGANRVTQSPGAAAAAKATKWLNNVNAAAQKWERNVGKLTVEEWRTAYINKGVPRIASGAQASATKFQTALTPLFSYMSAGLATVNAMDDSTPGGRDAKMLAWADYMRRYQAP